MDFLPVAERLECAVAQIGKRFAATVLPMHVALQGVIDEALADWSTDASGYEELESLVATRITVPKKTDYVPVINLPDEHEPVGEPPFWPLTW